MLIAFPSYMYYFALLFLGFSCTTLWREVIIYLVYFGICHWKGMLEFWMILFQLLTLFGISYFFICQWSLVIQSSSWHFLVACNSGSSSQLFWVLVFVFMEFFCSIHCWAFGRRKVTMCPFEVCSFFRVWFAQSNIIPEFLSENSCLAFSWDRVAHLVLHGCQHFFKAFLYLICIGIGELMISCLISFPLFNCFGWLYTSFIPVWCIG